MLFAQLQLEDIADPSPYLPGEPVPTWLIIVGVLIGLIIVGIISFLIYLKKTSTSHRSHDSQAAFEAARQEISNTSTANAAETAVSLSFALRRYLAAATRDPALFQTHEEFLLSDSALKSLPDGARQPVTDYFESLAELKYGNTKKTTADLEDIIAEARQLLINLHSTQPQFIS